MKSNLKLTTSLQINPHPLFPNPSPSTTEQSNTANIKFPEISLPSFSGKYEDRIDFHDVFESTIHNSSNLTDIQKFYYLRSCLKAEALNTIKEIKVSAGNYESPWTLLKQRFKNTRLIIKVHIQGILTFKRLDKPQSTALKNLYNTINNHLTALKNLVEPTIHQWSMLLVFLITNKLDPETRDRWEAYHAKNILSYNDDEDKSSDCESKPYSFENLMRFLYKQTTIQEVREENRTINTKGPSYKNFQSKPHINRNVNNISCRVSNIKISKSKCAICNDNHTTFTCKQLTNLNSSQRYLKVRELKLRINRDSAM